MINYPIYLNLFRTERVYGGPEEGGWWYTAGSLVESVFVGYIEVDCVENEKGEEVLKVGDVEVRPGIIAIAAYCAANPDFDIKLMAAREELYSRASDVHHLSKRPWYGAHSGYEIMTDNKIVPSFPVETPRFE